MSLLTNIVSGVIGVVVGAALTYYLGKKRDLWRIKKAKDIEKDDRISEWKSTVLRESRTFKNYVEEATFENRRDLKDRAASHATTISEFRDNAPPGIAPDEIQSLEEYLDFVQRLDYQEVHTSSVPFGKTDPFKQKRRERKRQERQERRKEDFQEKIDSYLKKSDELESLFD